MAAMENSGAKSSAKPGPRVLRKVGIVLGALLALLVAAAIIVPLVVDVDKFRPRIEQSANEHLNGKLELGKLSLSLWGQIRIDIQGIKLNDAQGASVLAVQDAFFHLPFLSILSGAPELELRLKEPALSVLKDKRGKLNVLALIKTSADPAGSPAAGAGGGPASGNVNLPGIATRARLGLELSQAILAYRDETTGMKTEIRDLNVRLKDLSLSRETHAEVWANLDTVLAGQKNPQTGKAGAPLSVRGPVRLEATLDPKVSAGKLDTISVQAKLNLDDLDIALPGTFEKKKGVAAHGSLAMTADEREAKISELGFTFLNAEIQGSGTVALPQAKPAGGPGSTASAASAASAASGDAATAPAMNLAFHSNEIPLAPWSELIPSLKAYELGGSARLEAQAKGPTDRLDYSARLTVAGLTAKAPNLKAQPRIDGEIDIVTNQVRNLLFTMKAPGNELRIQGKVLSFEHPRADFQITSSGMDLNQLVNFPPPGQKPAATATGGAGGAPGGNGEAADYDAMLAPLRANPAIATLVANLGFDIKSIEAEKIKISDLRGKFSCKDLVASLDAFSMRLFGGAVTARAQFNLKPAHPTYQFSTQVADLDMSQAVASQMAMFKDTVTGKAQFSGAISGASFDPEPAIANLQGKGTLKVKDAAFVTIDVNKMVVDGLNGAIDRIAAKVPALQGKQLHPNLPAKGSRYDFISSDYTIGGSKFALPNFTAKALPNQGIDLKGQVTVGMKDMSLASHFDILDTYNLTHAKDLTAAIAGGPAVPVLADKSQGQVVHFPVSANCNLKAPCYSYTEVPEFLTQVALKNMAGAATGRAKSELQKRSRDLIQKAPAPAQNILNGISGKLFH